MNDTKRKRRYDTESANTPPAREIIAGTGFSGATQ